MWRRVGALVLALAPGLALAQINSPITNPSQPQAGSLLTANDLADLHSFAAARVNLGLGSLATLGVGTALVSSGGNLNVDTGTSGAKVPLLNGTNSWSGVNTFSSSIGAVVGGSAAGQLERLRIQTSAGFADALEFLKGTTLRWQIESNNDAETGNNIGSNYNIFAYGDTGTFLGTALQINRGSGFFNDGKPAITTLAPYRQTYAIAGGPGATIGNKVQLGDTADQQPTETLGTDPLSVTNGSPTVTVTWTNCCVTGGPVGPSVANIDVWVKLLGAAAVGGITPSGWLEVQSIVDANSFTVTWTGNATSTTTGGGSAVTIRPSAATIGDYFYETLTTGAGGFPMQHADIEVANPEFLPPAGSANIPAYEGRWVQFFTPPDATQTKSFSAAQTEIDYINRGSDEGYCPDIFGCARTTIGFWLGPNYYNPAIYPGGGTSKNWNTVFSIFENNGLIGVYDGFSILKNALVGAGRDPTGHGGVGSDYFGAYDVFGNNPFTTANGSSTVTVQTVSGGATSLVNQVNGNTVFISGPVTVNNVIIGGQTYVIAGVNQTNHTFTITGSGVANASGAGGSTGLWLAWENNVPYAPMQYWGRWLHGIETKNFVSEDGGLISTQPGNGFVWNDGSGSASVNSTEISAGNIGVSVNPVGTGAVTLGGGRIDSGVRVVVAAGAVTVALSDYHVCINKTSGAATAVNLPATPVTGRSYTIDDCKGDAAANNITVTPAAGNIDGAATFVINANYGSWSGYYTGTIWKTTAAR